MKQSDKFAIFTTIWVVFLLVAYSFFWYWGILPKTIESRAKDLDLMQYNGMKDKFVAKDSLHISGWDLYYLQYGNMNGY